MRRLRVFTKHFASPCFSADGCSHLVPSWFPVEHGETTWYTRYLPVGSRDLRPGYGCFCYCNETPPLIKCTCVYIDCSTCCYSLVPGHDDIRTYVKTKQKHVTAVLVVLAISLTAETVCYTRLVSGQVDVLHGRPVVTLLLLSTSNTSRFFWVSNWVIGMGVP